MIIVILFTGGISTQLFCVLYEFIHGEQSTGRRFMRAEGQDGSAGKPRETAFPPRCSNRSTPSTRQPAQPPHSTSSRSSGLRSCEHQAHTMFTSYRREGLYSRNFLLADSSPQLRRACRVSTQVWATGSRKVRRRPSGERGRPGRCGRGGREGRGGGSALRLLLEDGFPRGYSGEVVLHEPKLCAQPRQSRCSPPPPPPLPSALSM